MKKLHVAQSPLSNNIYCGTLIEKGKVWGANQTDVTVECLCAVAAHGLKFGKPIELRAKDGSNIIRITVERIEAGLPDER